jgi:hypothetical protein
MCIKTPNESKNNAMMESNLMKRGNLGTVLMYGPIRIIIFTPFELFYSMVKKGMAHKGPDRQTLNDEYRHIA